MLRVSVLGGAGFIGTALCRRLFSEGVDFQIIDLKPSRSFPDRSIVADIRDSNALHTHMDGDVIVNLVAVHRDDVTDSRAYYDTNVDGTGVVCKVAEEKGINRIVFTSSVAVYGFAPVGTGEDGKIAPFNDYGKSKYQGEEVLRAWRNRSPANRGLVIVRPTVVFGEGNRGNVYNLLNQIARGQFVMIGSGKNRKSMAYVENVAAFLQQAIESKCNDGMFNYVDTPDMDMNTLVSQVRHKLFGKSGVGIRLPYPVGITIGKVADVITRYSRKKLPVSSIRVRKFCGDTAFSSAKGTLDNFVPPFALQQGLDRTLEKEFLDPDPEQEVFFTE